MLGIIDCNSFYCGCERLFRPELGDKPVVVLSNNDGCIISRTDEAKNLGVEMAGPYFLAKPNIEKYNVSTFSSNYHLYGDMSWRVMETLRTIFGSEKVEVYSVDEAFVDLSDYDDEDYYTLGLRIKDTVEQWTGIKVSVGIAPTKVLSKVANYLAKKNKLKTKCVVVLEDEKTITAALQKTPVGEVWGVGRKYATKLQDTLAIFSAYDLSRQSEAWAHKNMGGVVGVRLIKELNGEQGRIMEEPLTTKKMIATTRMFGRDAGTITEIKEAIATYTASAAEKLRRQECVARTIEIFVVQKDAHMEGKRFRHGHKVSTYTNLQVASADTTMLSAAATALVDQIFIPGQKYKKAGVMLSGIEPANEVQSNLFAAEDAKKNDALMQTIDNINFAMRDDAVKLAASGTTRNWKMRSELRSPRYTTRWEELAEVS